MKWDFGTRLANVLFRETGANCRDLAGVGGKEGRKEVYTRHGPLVNAGTGSISAVDYWRTEDAARAGRPAAASVIDR